MSELLATITAFPTVVFTILLGVVLVYWVFVLVGAVDVDALGGAQGGVEGAAKGALDGAVKGALEGAAKGAAEGAAKGVSEGGLAPLLSALSLTKVPATIALSFIVLFAWAISALLSSAAGALGASVPFVLVALVVSVLALVGGVLGAAIAVRPLAGMFVTHPARKRDSFFGHTGTVDTGRVDGSFGQVRIEDGGASQLVSARCDSAVMKKGERALIVSYDEARAAYVVEPMDAVLGGQKEA